MKCLFHFKLRMAQFKIVLFLHISMLPVILVALAFTDIPTLSLQDANYLFSITKKILQLKWEIITQNPAQSGFTVRHYCKAIRSFFSLSSFFFSC